MYDIQSLEICPEPEYAHIDNAVKKLKLLRYNRTSKMLDIQLAPKQPIDETTEGTVLAAKWNNGKWLYIPFIPYLSDICSLLYKHYPEQMSYMMINFGVKNPDRCPFPAGNYAIHNYLMNTKYEVNSVLPITGRFLFKVIVRKIATKEIFFCLEGTSQQTMM
ncbi:uncharacterized protein [Diabrotica undecimpunctata]